ncbi:hypothetical protein M5689_012613 [Euphorbia peplus]|nr:hypothetical protein M5689_012613 [Euphorbia peplus]
MAQFQKLVIFVLAIVFYLELLQFQSISARPVKFVSKKGLEKKRNNDSFKLHQTMKREQMLPPVAQTGFTSRLSDKDDFRPTSPGYSPGVGHPKAVFANSQSDHIDHSIARKEEESSTDDFRPTEPGYSPGVGHPMEVATSSNKDRYRPTQPGHSPGTAHPKEESSTDDFRPTAPGFSPGVGHRKEVVTVAGVENDFSGTKDDYRPTQPGHSPGVGHKNL